MATQSVSYLPGEDPGTAKANAEYQEALQKMLASLDARQNRMFDPQLLALAEGFLKPTQTGSFGESLGYAAGSLRAAQEKQALEDQKLAEARLGVASKGLELERQRARERAYEEEMKRGQPAEPAAPAAATVGDATRFAQVAAAGSAPAGAAPQAQAPQGIRVGPGMTGFPTREQFLAMQRREGKPLPDALKAWQDLSKSVEEVRDVGTYNRATGMFYSNPNVSEVDRKIGQSTYTMPAGIAFQLDAARIAGDQKKYQELVQRFMQGAGGEPPKSKQQSELEAKEAEAYATESAKKAVEQEANLDRQYTTAQRVSGSSQRLMDLVKQSPQAFGLFQQGNLMSSIGTLLSSTIRAGGTTIGLGDIEGAVRQAMGNVRKEDIARVALAASELANIELAFAQMELAKQGQVTEGERAIVRRLGGSISDTAEVLMQKAALVKSNADFNIRLADKFYDLKEKNPRLTFTQFMRSSEGRQMYKDHEEKVSRMFAPQSATGTQRPAASATGVAPATTGARPGASPYQNARQRADELLGR